MYWRFSKKVLLRKQTGGLSFYDEDMKKIYITDYEDIDLVKNGYLDFIGNTNEPDGTSTDHECFYIHDDLFDGFLAQIRM